MTFLNQGSSKPRLVKSLAMAIALTGTAVVTSTVSADIASGTSGVKITSEDGKFWAKVGGKFQWDYYANDLDDSVTFGSGSDADGAERGSAFRRMQVVLVGKMYDWTYLVVNNWAGGGGSRDLSEVWIRHPVGKYGSITIGQRKPWRSFDEYTDDAKTLTVERNLTSGNGIYGLRFYGQGLFYANVRPVGEGSLWSGASVYSLGDTIKKDQRNEGMGYNARVAYAPVVTDTSWYHMGVSYSNDTSEDQAEATTIGNKDRGSLYARFSPYYNGAPGLFGIAEFGNDGNKATQSTVHVELAAASGPFLAKTEYATANFSEDGREDETVEAFSVEGSWVLTGETHPYRKEYGTMNALVPKGTGGAWELAAGFNQIKNDDVNATGSTSCRPSGVTVTKCEGSYYYLTANYYMNKATRFILQYSKGELDLGEGGVDEPSTIQFRAQLQW